MLGFNPLASSPLAGFPPLGASLNAVAVTLVIQATAPSISSGVSLTTPVTPFVVGAGTVIVVAGTSLSVPTKTFVISNPTPSIFSGKAVAVNVTNLTLNPHNPSFASGLSVVVPNKQFVLSAFEVAVYSGKSIVAYTTPISVVAQTPSVASGKLAVVPNATVELSAFNPSLSSSYLALVPTKDLTVLAETPSVSASVFITVVTVGETKNFSLLAVTPILTTGKSSFVPSVNMQVTSPTAYLSVFNKDYSRPRTTIVMAENRLLLLTDVKRPKTIEVILPETANSRVIILT